jgi:hypothetical protein
MQWISFRRSTPKHNELIDLPNRIYVIRCIPGHTNNIHGFLITTNVGWSSHHHLSWYWIEVRCSKVRLNGKLIPKGGTFHSSKSFSITTTETRENVRFISTRKYTSRKIPDDRTFSTACFKSWIMEDVLVATVCWRSDRTSLLLFHNLAKNWKFVQKPKMWCFYWHQNNSTYWFSLLVMESR